MASPPPPSENGDFCGDIREMSTPPPPPKKIYVKKGSLFSSFEVLGGLCFQATP